MKPCLLALLATLPLVAADFDFEEKFADPATRADALTELVPGTRDWFFHHALNQQLTGDIAAFDRTMADWLAATRRKENPVEFAGYDTLRTRELLLRYEADPEKNLAALINTLGLTFNDARPDARAIEKLPDTLDPALISPDAFEKLALEKHPKAPWESYQQAKLIAELDQVAGFSEARVRHSITSLREVAHPGLVDLVERGLKFDDPIPFDAYHFRKQLTLAQLEEIRRRVPTLASDDAFVSDWLVKLRRHSDTDFDLSPSLHAAWLRELRTATADLPTALTPLKTHVLHHLLRLQQETGEPNLDDFLAYLAIPRRSHALITPTKRDNLPDLDLDRGFREISGCPPVSSDTRLVRDLLHHFLADTDTADRFAPYIERDALTRIHAEARLLAGADPDRWGRLLDPSDFADLREETRIAFAPGRPVLLDADAPVSLALDLKNTPELLVRIHQLDLPAILRRTGDEPDVDLDLAGLVPHHTRTLKFDQPPLVRHRETIDLPELDGPGAWIVEFVSQGHDSRALIRKGRLIPYLDRSATGWTVRVFDEKADPVTDATLTLGSETFTPDDGLITVPYAEHAATGSAILTRGPLATTVEIDDRSDRLQLLAKIHLDREQLRADARATARLAIELSNHREPLPLDLIENARLTLSAKLVSGITTEHVVADDLKLEPVVTVPFQVPADTVSLTLKLDATVVPRDGADPVDLTTSETFDFNSLLKGRFAHAHISPTPDGVVLDVRGRNGEPLADRAVDFTCYHELYGDPVKLRLRTNADGRVRLGSLDGIKHLHAKLGGQHVASFGKSDLRPSFQLPRKLILAAGETPRLPLEAEITRSRYSLVEYDLTDATRADLFGKLVAAGDQLAIAGLPAGHYALKTPSSYVDILVRDTQPRDHLLATPDRITPHTPATTPALVEATTDAGNLQLRLAATSPTTRVHVVGTRFLDTWTLDRRLAPFSPVDPPDFTPGFTACGFLTGRILDEETQYILDRRARTHLPGSLLPRPGLLAHRWSEEESDGNVLPPLEGEAGRKSTPSTRFSRRESEDDPFAAGGGSPFGSIPDFIDYLARSSELRYDLTPGDDGTLTLPLAAFEGCQSVRVVVTDRNYYSRRILPLPETPALLRDRRLARPFDAAKHHLGTRRAAALMKGAEATIENVLDADWRAFTTLEDAHAFLFGATGSDRLREMAGLLDWPDFDGKAKLAFWSDHACHEVHLFIARRDPEFFAKHVKRTLEQKLEPTFIDDYLLGRDLTPYLRPYAWERLNAAEKALLARALPDARPRVVTDLEQRWELEAPKPEQQTQLFTQTLRGTDLATTDSLGLARFAGGWDSEMGSGAVPKQSAGATYILQRLRNIIIPVIDFEDVSVEEAIDFLRQRSIELDTLELDPAKKGVNLFLRAPSGGQRISSLKLRNVPLADALNYICEATRLRWSTDDFAVNIRPATETGEQFLTRSFQVPPDFMARISGVMNDEDGFSDPFDPENGNGGSALMRRMTITEALKANGVSFPEGASAQYDPSTGRLLIRNTPTNVDLVGILSSTLGAPSAQAADTDYFSAPELPNAVGDSFAFAAYTPRRSWSADRPQTRIWQESNYDHHRSPSSGESLIPLNAFWIDLARWDGNGPFLSPHFNACTHSANDALMCLALLDLPFKADRPEVKTDGPTLRVKAREPMLLYYKDTRETDQVAPDSPVLVRQTFHRLDDRFRTEKGRKVENTVTGDFRTGVAYGASLVVTNPTGAGRRIDVLAQIPAGSIPLAGKESTLSETRDLEPYGVLKFDLAFYFPDAGDFSAYPLQVAEDDTILASAEARTLRVTTAEAEEDKASWPVIARDGTADDVLARLASANLHEIEEDLGLDLIAWRMRDRDFYEKAVAVLRDRLVLPQTLARYAFLHGDTATMRTWLENSRLVFQVGDFLASPLLDITPVEHNDWLSLEFDPLVNPRAHRLGDNPWFSQSTLQGHYEEYLAQLHWKPSLSADDQLHLTWFLFLQDRTDDAVARFAEIDGARVSTKLAYDYLGALVLFHRSKPAEAAAIARTHTDLPPGPWAERFAAVLSQADEIAALTDNTGDAKQAETAASGPLLELALADNGQLRLTHRGLEQVELSLYQIDLEMLFSRNPFLQDTNELPGTRPNLVQTIELNGDTTTVDLPEDFRRGNVLVSADAGSAKTLRILDSRALQVACRRADPVLRVRGTSGAPVSAAYVKVYVERDGYPEFLKDGYTDLRGMFDYSTLTDGSPVPTGRLAIFVHHPDHGSRTLVVE